MSRQEAQSTLEEILVTSRAIVELGDPEVGEPPSKLCEALRVRRRALLERLHSQDSGQRG
ncbi:MAG TPA: hypothetical protein VGH28_17980 [Polyangiaceae bacterium]|jgi:hypothetical protein